VKKENTTRRRAKFEKIGTEKSIQQKNNNNNNNREESPSSMNTEVSGRMKRSSPLFQAKEFLAKVGEFSSLIPFTFSFVSRFVKWC
jgi:hypothetical protein